MYLFMAMKQPPKILSLYHENAHHKDYSKFRAQRKISRSVEIESAVVLVGNDQEIAHENAEQKQSRLSEGSRRGQVLIVIRAATVHRMSELINPARHLSLRKHRIAKRKIHDRHHKGASQRHPHKQQST